MPDQYFPGGVGQVAGGNIINLASQSLWDLASNDLRQELLRCKSKLLQARLDHFLNVPFFLMLCSIAASVWLLITGRIFRPEGLHLMYVVIASFLIPAYWLNHIRQRRGAMVAFYRERIRIIDVILQDRG